MSARLPKRFIEGPWRYDLWQAYSIMSGNGSRRDWVFGIPSTLAFPASDVDGFRVWKDRRWRGAAACDSADPGTGRFRLDINLPGLLGPGGPGPLHLCDSVARETRAGNPALQDFLDIFHNRFMRRWLDDGASMLPELGPYNREGDDLPTTCAFAVSGALVGGLRNRELAIKAPGPTGVQAGRLPDTAFLVAAAVWALHPPTVCGLRKLVRLLFGIACEVEQFHGAWADIAEKRRTRLGVGGSRAAGRTALLGRRAFDAAAGIRLRLLLGDEEQYRAFIPGGGRYGGLAVLVSAYAGCTVTVDYVRKFSAE